MLVIAVGAFLVRKMGKQGNRSKHWPIHQGFPKMTKSKPEALVMCMHVLIEMNG